MNHRELAQALAALTPDEVSALVTAAENLRNADSVLGSLSPKKGRKKRGPNKPKAVAAPAPAPAAPAKRRGRPPAAAAKAPAKSPAFSSALDKLKAVKEGGVKIRRPSNSTDEGGDE